MSKVIVPSALLNRVVKPSRYTGQEWNTIVKEQSKVDVSFALAFPDVYEVGMSYLGYKILYHILNGRQEVAAERVYAPWVDMEEQMRNSNIPLFSLESFRPLGEFDFVGFTLQYEMSYSNILNMLDLGGIPLLACDRNETQSFVVGGGPCVYNPEPLADFFDIFLIGEAEELILEIVDCYKQWKQSGRSGGRAGFLKEAALIEGVYVPSCYDVNYNADGTVMSIGLTSKDIKPQVHKRVIKDLETVDFPTRPVVPFGEIVHDRIMLEIFRGCTRGCRFCQAGMIYRPVRERKVDTLVELAQQLVNNTGYNEISLVSLSTADYSCLHPLITALMSRMKEQGVSVSLPSLRIDSFSIQLAQEVQQVRKSGLTFAPEAGTQRLRDVINKGVNEDNLRDAVCAAFRAGWSSVKLYFMIGLPTEEDDDIRGIAKLAYQVLDWYKEVKGRRGAKVTVSVSSFVPKPHTPFQWFGQDSIEQLERKQHLLRDMLKNRDINFNWHDAKTSFLEGVFARGDRRLGKVLLKAWSTGARFDGWSEQFDYENWLTAFAECNIDPHFYANRERQEQEIMPWSHIQPGVEKKFLWREYQQALKQELTADCRRGDCGACGVCSGLGVGIIDWGNE